MAAQLIFSQANLAHHAREAAEEIMNRAATVAE